jgi:glutathione S-transferase
MLTLYSGPVSWFSRKVEIALYEKNLPFRQIIVPFTQTQGYRPKPDDVTRINPKGLVPVMIDGEVELYDSSIIIEYLDEAYPTPQLLPTLPRLRAQCRLWDDFGDEVMLKPIRNLMHRTEPHDHAGVRWRELEDSAAMALPQIESCFEHLEKHLQHTDYLCEAFSLADISCVMAVFWSNRLAGPEFGARQNLRRWYQAVMERATVTKVTGEIRTWDERLSARVMGAK